MKLKLAGAIAAIAFMGAAGAVSAHITKTPAPAPEFSAKQTPVKKVRYTYRECMADAMTQCRALHPSDTPARVACVEDIQTRICNTLPGAP